MKEELKGSKGSSGEEKEIMFSIGEEHSFRGEECCVIHYDQNGKHLPQCQWCIKCQQWISWEEREKGVKCRGEGG